MNARTKMILALGITATMLAVVFAAVPGDDSEAAPGPSITTHPYYSNYSTFVSNGPITYTGSSGGIIYYFTEDPTSDIHRVMRCEMAFNDLQTVSPVNGNDYWVMRYTYGTSLTGYTRLIDDVPLVFLDKGTWTVNVVSISWSASSISFSSNNTSQYIPLTDGHGSSEQFIAERPAAYYFSTDNSSTPWYAQTVTYSTDPVSSKTPAPAYTGTAKLLSDYHWKKYTTTATFTGEVQQNSNYIMFEKDSAEETAFVDNIVNLNKYDGSAYANNPITVDSKQVVLYACEKISNWSSPVTSIYLGVDSGSGYVYSNYNVTTTEVPTGTEVNSKITVNPQFSIAVQFDTSRIQYVKMTQSSGGYSSNEIDLESDRLYEFKNTSSNRYVMSVVLKPGVNDIGPADVSTYITGQKGSGGGSEGNTVVHPYSSYNGTTWLSDGPVTYNWSMGYNWTYFNKAQDPTEDIKKVINCEMSFDDLKTVTPTYGNDYWVLGYGNMETQFNKNYFVTEPALLYLEKGTWNINIANTNCDYLRLVNANQLVGGRGDSESITLSEGKGTLEIELERPTAFYFENGGGSFGWLEYTVEYNINPDLSYDVITDFPKTANIVTNYQWVKSTSVGTVDGKISISNMYDNSLLFVSGSPEEAAFITNVVNKNLMDGSEYRTEYLDVYNQKIVSYTIRETSRDLSDYLYLSIDRSHGNVYTGESIDVDSERISTGEQTNSKFYAGKHFSIAVSYDTSRIMYVAIGFTTVFGEVDYAPLQSGRLYEFDMESAAEYELYAVLKNGENDMSPLEVGIYTSGLSEEDNYGTVFAIVAIAFCVLAFGTLFMAGRRPKWNDNTGLPDFDASTPENPSVDTGVPEDVTPESTEDE